MRELTEEERAEVERDAVLPQLDARELVDEEYLERAIKEMYTEVAEHPEGEFHFLTGRPLAEGLGYDPGLLDRIPAEAIESFAGVGHYLDLAGLSEGECVVDLGSGSGTDLFCAAVLVGPAGRALGIDMTPAQLDKARRLRDAHGLSQVELIEARIEEVPLEDGIADCVVSNGVINLAPDKGRVFREAARLLKPGGRLALADIVSGRPLVERTRRKTDLWAACIGGAIPRDSYLGAIEDTGLRVEEVRENEYEFLTAHALEACDKYGVVSVTLVARN
ncbi:MAG TPA: methyltransferase domain-containing protein [Miltoncostaeaceae bacterium]|nr:methyltransferase domain-containing protein [Miltoncostaeaceae bacterium]